jgi:hypothetical protein
MASRLLKPPRTTHPPAVKGSVRPGHVLVIAKLMNGISHEDGGVSLDTLRVGSRVLVLDITTARVPTVLCMREGDDRRWPWVVSQIEHWINKGNVVLTRENG